MNQPPTLDLSNQRRNLSQIISDSIQIYTENFRGFFLIALAYLPIAFLGYLVQDKIDDSLLAVGLLTLPLLLVDLVLRAPVQGAMILALGDVHAGRPVDPKRAYAAVRSLVGPLISSAFRAIGIAALWFITIVGIPIAFNRLVRWLFTDQAVVIDHRFGEAALVRSSELVKGRWWNTVGRMIVISVVGGIPSFTLGIPVESLESPFIIAALKGLIDTFFLPFGLIALTLVYLDLNTQKEVTDDLTSPA